MKKELTVFIHYLKTKRLQHMKSRTAVEARQKKRVVQHLRYLKKHSPYFAERLPAADQISFRTLSELPLMTKDEMMRNFDKLNTCGISKEAAFAVAFGAEQSRDFSTMLGDVTVGLSSGTSGNRGLFIVSEAEQAAWAGTMLAKLLPHGLFGARERIAFFLRANSRLYESVTSSRIAFRFFDLLIPVDDQIVPLRELNPTILVAPPSVLRLLAEQQQAGRLQLKPAKIISVAEVLEPLDREFIESAFRQPVHQVYQCTEGFLGMTCRFGTIHLNEELVHIEKNFLDAGRSRFSPVITDFTRKTQPIIRYELNDILVLKKEPCPCGSPFTAIAAIEGRCDDVFYFERVSGEQIPVFPDFVRRWVLTASADIEEYRVRQYRTGQLEIQLKGNGNENLMRSRVLGAIRQFMDEQQLMMPVVTFAPYEAQPRGSKLKRIERVHAKAEAAG